MHIFKNIGTETMAPVRKSYSARFKLNVIQYAEENGGNRVAERKFDVSEKLVRDWLKAKDSLLLMKRSKKANRGHKARWPALETVLRQWIVEQRAEGHGLNTVQVRMKAQSIAQELGVEGFVGGPSWCYRFMKRNQLSMRTRTTMCQQLPADFNEKVENFQNFIESAVAKFNVLHDHIINMDKVPLTFDIPMGRSVNERGQRSVNIKTTGHEKSHFTVVLACCADGKKLPPFIIFKRKTMPRDPFPSDVIIHVNGKGWMDEEVMGVWLQKSFSKRPGGFFKTQKALLVMDSMRAHITEKVKQQIGKLNTMPVIIPGGLTKMLQP